MTTQFKIIISNQVAIKKQLLKKAAFFKLNLIII